MGADKSRKALAENSPPLLFLVRHPQTSWNLAFRYQGQQDVPLDRTGQRQLGLVLERLRGEPVDLVASSPLKRCLSLARRLAAEKGLTVWCDDRLKELHYGSWEGKPHEQIKQAHGPLLERWIRRPEEVSFPGGESFRAFTGRAKRFLRDLRARRFQNAVVVSHGGTMRIMICLLLRVPLARVRLFQAENASLTLIRDPFGSAELLVANDTCHLSSGKG